MGIVCLLALGACRQTATGKNGVTYHNPVEYNDYIVNRQSKLMQNILLFGKVANESIDSAEALMRESVNQAGVMIHEIEGMPAYQGDSVLRNAAIRSFSFYKRVFGDEYMQVLEIRRKGDAATTDDIDRINDIVKRIGDEEETFDHEFKQAQEQFAKRFHMRLRENPMAPDVKKYNEQ